VKIPGGKLHDEQAKDQRYRLGVLTVVDSGGVQEESSSAATTAATAAEGSSGAAEAIHLDVCRRTVDDPARAVLDAAMVD
jgi:hypothetical protein